MNKARRKELAKIYAIIEEAKDRLEQILFDEEDCLDNIPENLQWSERYEKNINACDQMREAVDQLDYILECIESAQD